MLQLRCCFARHRSHTTTPAISSAGFGILPGWVSQGQLEANYNKSYWSNCLLTGIISPKNIHI